MHRRVFGDAKQLAIASAGNYLGDSAALDHHDRRRDGQGERVTRPETWSRDTATARARSVAGDRPPARPADPAAAPAQASAAGGLPPRGARPETGGRRSSDVVLGAARVSDAPADVPASQPAVGPRYASAESGLAEESETYVIYRPDRGYAAASRDDGREGARLTQAAAKVSDAANSVRDAAIAAGTVVRASQDRRG
jgi:hypothetical protein